MKVKMKDARAKDYEARDELYEVLDKLLILQAQIEAEEQYIRLTSPASRPEAWLSRELSRELRKWAYYMEIVPILRAEMPEGVASLALDEISFHTLTVALGAAIDKEIAAVNAAEAHRDLHQALDAYFDPKLDGSLAETHSALLVYRRALKRLEVTLG